MRNRYWLVFAAIFVWKVLLYIFAAQPIPANDAFFYDGAVVHQIVQGGFYNPTIAQAFPICGAQVFSAYPPLYHLPLLAWMSVFGVSAFSAMGLHIVLFGIYLGVLLLIFQRLRIPAWCSNVAGFFLLVFTFHDRPDSFAHVLGVLAIYACIRSRNDLNGDVKEKKSWIWLMVLLNVLTLCTSLQVGGFYFGVVCLLVLADAGVNRRRFPFVPMTVMIVLPIALVLCVKKTMPLAWSGFLEHLHQTPSLTGFHFPNVQDILKIVRTVPGIFVVTGLFAYGTATSRFNFNSALSRRYGIILAATLLPAFGIVLASLTIITPNIVAIASYLQPVIVAVYLALAVSIQVECPWLRLQIACLIPAILLGSIRAIGITTWGLVCAHDVSYSRAVKLVDQEISGHETGYKVVMSSCFLYGAATHKELDLIHSDWLATAHGDSRESDSKALLALKPRKIVLSQFDYYRRYREVLQRIQDDPGVGKIEVVNTAHVPSPDSINRLQKVVQHISWAPIIVNISWH